MSVKMSIKRPQQLKVVISEMSLVRRSPVTISDIKIISEFTYTVLLLSTHIRILIKILELNRYNNSEP